MKIFSRNCEDRTAAFPDVVSLIKCAAAGGNTRSLVLDAELVPVDIDPSTGSTRFKSFQELSTRARGQVTEDEVSVRVCVFVFDMVYWNGSPLLRHPLRKRRALIADALPSMSAGAVQMATSLELLNPPADDAGRPGNSTAAAATTAVAATADTDATGSSVSRGGRATTSAICSSGGDAGNNAPAGDIAAAPPAAPTGVKVDATSASKITTAPAVSTVTAGPAAAATATATAQQVHEEVHELLLAAVAAGTEGLMLKQLEGPGSGYQPSRRCECSWVKLKKDYCEGLVDSLDLVPIGECQPLLGHHHHDYYHQYHHHHHIPIIMMIAVVIACLRYPISLRRNACTADMLCYSCPAGSPFTQHASDMLCCCCCCAGAWIGQGRKVKWFSPFLLAVWDPAREEYQSLCRCMSGFSDAFYTAATERLRATAIAGPKPYYNTAETPNVWFEPTEVWEIRGNCSPLLLPFHGICRPTMLAATM